MTSRLNRPPSIFRRAQLEQPTEPPPIVDYLASLPGPIGKAAREAAQQLKDERAGKARPLAFDWRSAAAGDDE